MTKPPADAEGSLASLRSAAGSFPVSSGGEADGNTGPASSDNIPADCFPRRAEGSVPNEPKNAPALGLRNRAAEASPGGSVLSIYLPMPKCIGRLLPELHSKNRRTELPK